MRILDLLEVVTSSKFLAANFRVTDIGHITVGKMVVKYRGVLPILGKQHEDAVATENHCIRHVDDASLYVLMKPTSLS